jgi:hypothetical protein
MASATAATRQHAVARTCSSTTAAMQALQQPRLPHAAASRGGVRTRAQARRFAAASPPPSPLAALAQLPQLPQRAARRGSRQARAARARHACVKRTHALLAVCNAKAHTQQLTCGPRVARARRRTSAPLRRPRRPLRRPPTAWTTVRARCGSEAQCGAPAARRSSAHAGGRLVCVHARASSARGCCGRCARAAAARARAALLTHPRTTAAAHTHTLTPLPVLARLLIFTRSFSLVPSARIIADFKTGYTSLPTEHAYWLEPDEARPTRTHTKTHTFRKRIALTPHLTIGTRRLRA